MLVSELIKVLEEYQKKNGDVQLYAESDDGKSSWVNSARVSLKFGLHWREKLKRHMIRVDGGY